MFANPKARVHHNAPKPEPILATPNWLVTPARGEAAQVNTSFTHLRMERDRHGNRNVWLCEESDGFYATYLYTLDP